MANAQTVTTLEAVHAGILSAIKAQFPSFKTVEAYREDRCNLPVPACLIELTEMDGAQNLDPGTGQCAVRARFEARLVIGFRQGKHNAKLEIRKLAAAFAVLVHGNRWGCPIGPAEIIGAYHEDRDPELASVECWRVEWQQVIHLGETEWKDEGDVPTPYFSYTPKIGPDYVHAYREGSSESWVIVS